MAQVLCINKKENKSFKIDDLNFYYFFVSVSKEFLINYFLSKCNENPYRIIFKQNI